jgi:UDP-N-acetylglucosamine 4,6-dehydratase
MSIYLVTGGTGSFGGAVVRRLLADPTTEQIRVFSRDEKKQDDMRRELNSDRLKFYIGDVRDLSSVKSAMVGVDYVFHAAALKQVPSCEFFPMEAVLTNILGTDNVLTAAIESGVKRVLCLSTDKAAYPINAMGISKAMMEKVARAKSISAGGTIICITRYGNVMASRGSVIPLFVEQIKTNKSLTVTDPDMTRFLMNLEDSVDLVQFALQHAVAGDMLIMKTPATTMATLAEAVKRLFNSSVKIEVIGTRHGEKVHETLLTREEFSKAEDLGDYYRVPIDNRGLNYSRYEAGLTEVTASNEYTSQNTRQLNVEETMALLEKVNYIKKALKQ